MKAAPEKCKKETSMTMKDHGMLVALMEILMEVLAPGLKELASVSVIGPHQWDEPELMGLLQYKWVIFVSSLHHKHVELSKFVNYHQPHRIVVVGQLG
jgi:hypothetical protein